MIGHTEARSFDTKLVSSALLLGGAVFVTELHGAVCILGCLLMVAGGVGCIDKDGYLIDWVAAASIWFTTFWLIARMVMKSFAS